MVRIPVYTQDLVDVRVSEKPMEVFFDSVTMYGGTTVNIYGAQGTTTTVIAICCDLTTAAGGMGRLPYGQWAKQLPSPIGAPAAGWFGAANATPAAGSGHYSWAVGNGDYSWLVDGTIPFEDHAIPPMVLKDKEYIALLMMNGAAGDVAYWKYYYIRSPY